MNNNETADKNFFEFTDYRQLLGHLYKVNKAKSPKFSYRYFARIAGFASPSFLKKVIDGVSDLSEDSILKISEAFKMSQDETHFFKNLVLFNQAKADDERKALAQEIFKSRGYRKFHPLSESQYNYFSNWYYIPVRELVGLDTFREDYEWIAKSIIPQITVPQAQRAIKELLQIGMIKREEDGNLKQVERIVTTPDEVVSSAIGLLHRELMDRAYESIQTVPREMRDISAVSLRISKDNVKRAKELIQKFRRQLVEEFMGDPSDAIYEFNMQLFPMTEFTRGGGNDKK